MDWSALDPEPKVFHPFGLQWSTDKTQLKLTNDLCYVIIINTAFYLMDLEFTRLLTHSITSYSDLRNC